ncbi:MAG: hypothetical protein AAFX99_02305 [Myxococcota bacterium]
MTVVVEGLGFLGEGYVQIEPGRFISIPHTLPGDCVDIEVGPWRRGRAWGQVQRWVKRMSKHVAPECPYYDRCSGCALRHMSPDDERDWKVAQLRQILGRYGPSGADQVTLDWLDAGQRSGHRARGRFRVVPRDDGVALGLRSTGVDGAVVDVRNCPAQSERSRALMNASAAWLEADPTRSYVEQVGVWTDDATGLSRVVFWVDPASDRSLWDAPLRTFAERWSVEVGVVAGEEDVWLGGPRWGVTVAPGRVVEPSLRSWVHATPRMASRLAEWVSARLGQNHKVVLDLCCGLGTMTFRLAQQAERVIAVDEDYMGCQALARAATRAGLHIEVRAGRVGQVLRKLRRELCGAPRPTAAVINPMRKPLGKRQLADLAALGVHHALYLGPSPVSAARDARVMHEMGFDVVHGAGVNLHPATAQIMLALEFRLRAALGES